MKLQTITWHTYIDICIGGVCSGVCVCECVCVYVRLAGKHLSYRKHSSSSSALQFLHAKAGSFCLHLCMSWMNREPSAFLLHSQMRWLSSSHQQLATGSAAGRLTESIHNHQALITAPVCAPPDAAKFCIEMIRVLAFIFSYTHLRRRYLWKNLWLLHVHYARYQLWRSLVTDWVSGAGNLISVR